ncbi:MAG: B12-binding domain-containing radical SAM protein [Anaerolineae bacterium]|nr:B12-binding domain-containing radical SAM protein [Anaerolineae bacterium]
MRILLVSPISKVWSSRKHIPLGLGYLAAVLERAGHPVQIYDAVVEDEPLGDVLERVKFEVVGISSTTPLINEAWEAAREAKAHGAVTILGGPHPTLLPDESMQRPEVDLVVRGEGEDAIVEIVSNLESRISNLESPQFFERAVWSRIAALSFRDENGEIVHNPLSPLREDLDSIPFPAHHLFKIERYTNLQPLTDGLNPKARAYTIITSRGCPYNCIYCSKAITGRIWRPRSPENVVAEWRLLVRDLGATEIGVTDDTMTLDMERAKTICRMLIAEGLNTVPWITIHGINARNTDEELLRLMKQAGCKRVGFGVESGNQCVLDSIKKQQTVDEVRRAFANARKAGLETMGFFIFGLPNDTEETMEDTIRLALELDPELANFMIAAPFPGTEMYNIVLREGHLFSHDWRDFAIHDEKARFEIGDLTAELVERKWREAYRRFYLRPGRLWRRVTRLDTWRRLPTYFSNFKRFAVGRIKKASS